jgi:hypothetical protein
VLHISQAYQHRALHDPTISRAYCFHHEHSKTIKQLLTSSGVRACFNGVTFTLNVMNMGSLIYTAMGILFLYQVRGIKSDSAQPYTFYRRNQRLHARQVPYHYESLNRLDYYLACNFALVFHIVRVQTDTTGLYYCCWKKGKSEWNNKRPRLVLEDEQRRIVLLHLAMGLLLQVRQEGASGGSSVCVIHG